MENQWPVPAPGIGYSIISWGIARVGIVLVLRHFLQNLSQPSFLRQASNLPGRPGLISVVEEPDGQQTARDGGHMGILPPLKAFRLPASHADQTERYALFRSAVFRRRRRKG